MNIKLEFADGFGLEGLRVGLVVAAGYRWLDDGDRLDPRFAEAAESARRGGAGQLTAARKAAARAMLRYGSYKPAGRAKPSSEYLLQAALEGEFPRVNFAVDATNAVSLAFGYPISIFDTARTGSALLLRRGLDGERYIFNPGGQEIELKDLLCVCRKDGGSFVPTANPVRDSMATKVFPGAANLAAAIYAPAGPEGADLEAACAMLSGYLGERSDEASWVVVGA